MYKIAVVGDKAVVAKIAKKNDKETDSVLLVYNLKNGKQVIICLKDYQIKNFTKHLDIPFILTDKSNLNSSLLNTGFNSLF